MKLYIKINIFKQSHFVCNTQLNIKEQKIFNKIMQRSYTHYYLQAIKKEQKSLHKNNM